MKVGRFDPGTGSTAVRACHEIYLSGLPADDPLGPPMSSQLTQIITRNATGNDHMIAINDQLGFEVLGHWPSWELDVAGLSQLPDVADVPDLPAGPAGNG